MTVDVSADPWTFPQGQPFRQPRLDTKLCHHERIAFQSGGWNTVCHDCGIVWRLEERHLPAWGAGEINQHLGVYDTRISKREAGQE